MHHTVKVPGVIGTVVPNPVTLAPSTTSGTGSTTGTGGVVCPGTSKLRNKYKEVEVAPVGVSKSGISVGPPPVASGPPGLKVPLLTPGVDVAIPFPIYVHTVMTTAPVLAPTSNNMASVPAWNDNNFRSVTSVTTGGSALNATPDHTPSPLSKTGTPGVVPVISPVLTTSSGTSLTYPVKKKLWFVTPKYKPMCLVTKDTSNSGLLIPTTEALLVAASMIPNPPTPGSEGNKGAVVHGTAVNTVPAVAVTPIGSG